MYDWKKWSEKNDNNNNNNHSTNDKIYVMQINYDDDDDGDDNCVYLFSEYEKKNWNGNHYFFSIIDDD